MIWRNKQQKNIALLITAAGSSTRFGSEKKEYLPIDENNLSAGTVLGRGLETFLETGLFSTVVITIPQNQQKEVEKALSFLPLGKSLIESKSKNIKFSFVTGGNSRQASVFEGLKSIKKLNNDVPDAVLVHDGARPFVTKDVIQKVIDALEMSGAAVPAVPAVDTQKIVDETGKIVTHLERKTVFAVQTPQAFEFLPLLEAHEKAEKDGKVYTDDTEIWDRYCGAVYISAGDIKNRKITYKQDLIKGC